MSLILSSLNNKILIETELNKSRMLLESVTYDMTNEQRTIVEGVYKDLYPLIEAALTADQINNIFKQAEQGATASGSNRTMLGKAVDVPGQVNDIINKAGKWLQDTTPVKFADQKFEDLKKKIGAKFPELDKQLTSWGTWMKENPGKTAFVIGILTTLASLAGGPVGGAIAGQVLRGAGELIKGSKLSTAVGQGIKTAAFGFLTGKALEMLGSVAENMRIKSIPFGPEDAGLQRVSFGASAVGDGGSSVLKATNVLVDDEMASAIQAAKTLLREPDYEAKAEGFKQLRDIAEIISSRDYRLGLRDIYREAWTLTKNNDSLLNMIKDISKGLTAASQGAVAGGMAAAGAQKPSAPAAPAPTSESVYKGVKLSESRIIYLIGSVTEKMTLREGILDTIKGAAGKAVGAVKQFGTNLTTKVTADKLLKAWKAAGSPTDSAAVAKIMGDAGVPQEVVSNVYTSMKIPMTPSTQAAPAGNADFSQSPAGYSSQTMNAPQAVPGSAPTTPGASSTPGAPEQSVQATIGMPLNDLKKAASKLRARDRQVLIAFIQKSLEGKPAMAEDIISELSTNKLAQYKTAAAKDAKAADEKGDYKKGDKRFSGIVKATKKQFDNETKKKTDEGQIYSTGGGAGEGRHWYKPRSVPNQHELSEGNDQEFHTGGGLGTPYPGTYEQETSMIKRKGGKRITAMTYESQLDEKWSEKYKKSINCNNPKGFSQRAHCQGRKK